MRGMNYALRALTIMELVVDAVLRETIPNSRVSGPSERGTFWHQLLEDALPMRIFERRPPGLSIAAPLLRARVRVGGLKGAGNFQLRAVLKRALPRACKRAAS